MIGILLAIVTFAILKWAFLKLFDTPQSTEMLNERSFLPSPVELQTSQEIDEQ